MQCRMCVSMFWHLSKWSYLRSQYWLTLCIRSWVNKMIGRTTTTFWQVSRARRIVLDTTIVSLLWSVSCEDQGGLDEEAVWIATSILLTGVCILQALKAVLSGGDCSTSPSQANFCWLHEGGSLQYCVKRRKHPWRGGEKRIKLSKCIIFKRFSFLPHTM